MKQGTFIVSGGAGFIGSHVTERLLMERGKVLVIDNFSSAKLENIKQLLNDPSITIVKEDLKKPRKLGQIVQKSEIIFHLAANPEVRVGETDQKFTMKKTF